MHRQRATFDRQRIRAAYELRDRPLSDRVSRERLEETPPEIDDVECRLSPMSRLRGHDPRATGAPPPTRSSSSYIVRTS
jgi:hypothetical protein